MIYHKCVQNSDEWDRLRCGIPTASAFENIITPSGKTCKSERSRKYMYRLLAEWRFGGPLMDPQSQYQSEWMERGHLLESQAVKAYEMMRDCDTQPGGFVTADEGLIGCSPDRLVGDDGLLEIKCPSPQVHMGYMVARSVDETYYPQLQGQLLITERKWVDIVSYSDCPGFPAVIIRVPRDEKYIELLTVALVDFVAEMMKGRVLIEKAYPSKPAPKSAPVSEEVGEHGEVDPDHPLGVSQSDLEVEF
jgi:hypothetical protein